MIRSTTSLQNRSAFAADSNGLFKVVVISLTLALSVRIVSAYCAPEDGSTVSAAPEAATEVQAATEVSERELRLRTIEDELLKKLSMGSSASPSEGTTTKLPDIKHVDFKQEAGTSPSSSAQGVSVTPKPTPAMQEAKTEPEQRTPRSSHIVPVSAPVTPRRVPQRAGSQDPKDLEHRLAIAESQATILSQELDATKENLQKSQVRVNELSEIVENGIAAPAPKFREVGGYVSNTNVQEERLALNAGSDRIIPSSSAPTARINRSNAPLRLGPGRNESALFPLSINSIVTIEHRTGVWYRIVTSSGARGWVSGDVLTFSDGDFPGSTVHIGGIRAENEPESLR